MRRLDAHYEVGDKGAQCRHCLRIVTRTPRRLIHHLRKFHPDVLAVTR